MTTHITAHATYKARVAIAERYLKEIQHTLDLHHEYQAKDPFNWGYAGDLEMVNDKLEELIDFLTGGKS